MKSDSGSTAGWGGPELRMFECHEAVDGDGGRRFGVLHLLRVVQQRVAPSGGRWWMVRTAWDWPPAPTVFWRAVQGRGSLEPIGSRERLGAEGASAAQTEEPGDTLSWHDPAGSQFLKRHPWRNSLWNGQLELGQWGGSKVLVLVFMSEPGVPSTPEHSAAQLIRCARHGVGHPMVCYTLLRTALDPLLAVAGPAGLARLEFLPRAWEYHHACAGGGAAPV